MSMYPALTTIQRYLDSSLEGAHFSEDQNGTFYSRTMSISKYCRIFAKL